MSLPPSGEIPQGAIRFNTDSQRLEFYAQGEWWVMSTDTPNLGQGTDSTPGVRGVWGGGYGTSPNAEINEIRYINISSTGDTQDFGDLSGAKSGAGAGQAASPTRGLFMSGNTKIDIDFITFASTGNATTFGNSTMANATYSSALSNSTRGIHAGGNPGNDTIEYVTISSTGNAVDFGNLVTVAVRGGGAASPTRGLIIGGRTAVSSGKHNVIQFITIATLGDSQDFGDLNAATRDTTGTCSNPTRAIVFGGVTPTSTADIDYVTIATTGNSTKFGDLSIACDSGTSVSSSTRGVHAISRTTPSGAVDVNTLEYVNIVTTGNSVDFGDANNNRMRHAWPTSNGHGGL